MDFVTYQQAVAITGKNKRTIQRSVSSGRLSYITKVIGGKEIKLFNRAELVALHGQVSPVSPMTVPLTNQPQVDYQSIAQIISQAITEAQQPLLDEISALSAHVKDLTHRVDNHKAEAEKVPEKKVERPVFLRDELKLNYCDDSLTFGSKSK
ncbi:hypothetical protein [Thalassotalea ganghwensis]